MKKESVPVKIKGGNRMFSTLSNEKTASIKQSKEDRANFLEIRRLSRKATGHKNPNMRKFWNRQHALDVKWNVW